MQKAKEIEKKRNTMIYRGSPNRSCYEVNPLSVNEATEVCICFT